MAGADGVPKGRAEVPPHPAWQARPWYYPPL